MCTKNRHSLETGGNPAETGGIPVGVAADDFMAALHAGTVCTNVYLRRKLPSLEECEEATRRAEESGKIVTLEMETEVPKAA